VEREALAEEAAPALGDVRGEGRERPRGRVIRIRLHDRGAAVAAGQQRLVERDLRE
jgi:hypothetical protein